MEKQLHLVLSHKYFEQVLSGEKKTEIRELTTKNFDRHFEPFGEGSRPKGFSSLVLYAGYEKNRPRLEISVIGVFVETFQDENGNDIEHPNENNEQDVLASVVYELGDILNKSNC